MVEQQLSRRGDASVPVRKDRRRRAPRGFTLIEVSISLAIVAILAALAAPNFADSMRDRRLDASRTGLSGDLALARIAAIKRGTRVVICASPVAGTCDGTDWSAGWMLYEDLPGGTRRVRDATDPVLRQSPRDTGDGIEIQALGRRAGLTNIEPVGQLEFASRGRSGGTTLVIFCDKRGEGSARLLAVSLGGRPRVESPATWHETAPCP